MNDTIHSGRRELETEVHIANRVNEAELFRGVARAFLDLVETLSFPIDYVEGYDPDDIMEMLRACANVSRARVERLAEEDVLAMVNEGAV